MNQLLLSCVLWLSTSMGLPAAPTVVEPITANGAPVTAERDGKSYPVFRLASDQKLVESINRVFTTSFAGEMRHLYEMSCAIARARDHRAGKPEDPEFSAPLYLLLSEEEGGYARRDFFLQSPDGKRAFVAANYVDLVVDQESVENGDFEEIFSHELGHLILRNLVGQLAGPRSNKMHQSMTLTDYRTAFDEGFAEHFQPVVRQNSTNALLARQQRGVVAPRLPQEFLSQRDQALRNFGPATDAFIHERTVPACSSARECFVLEETSTSFDPAQLRTGQQMLSSEGVNATVFLMLVSEEEPPVCNSHYDCTAFEARYRKLFEALADITPDPTQAPLIQLLESYRAKFPDDKRAVEDFLLLTRCATVSSEIPQQVEALDRASAHADIAGFRNQLKPLRTAMDSTITEVLAGKRKLDAAVGPELWVRNETFTHSSLWDPDAEMPLRINLNTATKEELATFSLFNAETVQTILQERKRRGYFESLDQLAAAAKLTATQTAVLKAAERSQVTAKPDPVQ